ncbi:MAG: ABC transporter permease, partial [Thermomicrobiales bacterium]
GMALAAIVGPLVWHRGSLVQDPAHRLLDPSLAFPLGTDRFGRDVFARALVGARWSLLGAALVTAGSIGIAVVVGIIAAIGNTWIEAIIGRIIETLLALPGLVMTLAITALLSPSFESLIVALVLTGWPGPARLIQQIILNEQTAVYIDGARVLGASRRRIMMRHLLPNVSGALAIMATNRFSSSLFALASLSFLGLGMQPPEAEWGSMVKDSAAYFQVHPWQTIAPGLCIAMAILAMNLLGNSVRDVLDPRSKRSW